MLNDLVGGEKVVVIGRAKGPAGVAFLSSADDRVLSFRLAMAPWRTWRREAGGTTAASRSPGRWPAHG